MTDSPWPAALEEALGGCYVLEREVGRGGMAVVYRAHGVVDGRAVAVKLIRPSLATAIGLRRFEREIRVAASLAHPLIVPLLASGGADELLYYVMPFIDGETLGARIARERRLSPADALAAALDVVDALGYAHGRSVLHRDVKPANVLLCDGRALIADFGLARTLGAVDTTRLTATGATVGTIEYMSPEQILAEDELDERVDVYGVGCMLFEALTGEPPFSGASLHDLVRRVLHAPPPRVRGFRVDVPVALDEAITRALAKQPEDRHPSMAAFAAVLRSAV